VLLCKLLATDRAQPLVLNEHKLDKYLSLFRFNQHSVEQHSIGPTRSKIAEMKVIIRKTIIIIIIIVMMRL